MDRNTPRTLDGDTPAVAHLRALVAESATSTYMTPGGIIRDKTGKRREAEHKVAEAVVRFAFDHAGITNGHLAPTGLLLDLLDGKPVS